MNKNELIYLILFNIEVLWIVMAPTILEKYAIIHCENLLKLINLQVWILLFMPINWCTHGRAIKSTLVITII